MEERFETFSAMAALGVSESLHIPNICSEFPGVKNSLKGFDLESSISMASGLMTLPQYYENTSRLEVLAHLICLFARGRKKPRRKNFYQWLNSKMSDSAVAHLEDPAEDVFISNVMTGSGNHRIFEGLWEANDFYLQEIIDILYTLPKREPYQRLRWEVESVLKLAEVLAERAGIERFTMGGGVEKYLMKLPTDRQMEKRSKIVRFSWDDFEKLKIDPEHLTSYIFSPEHAEVLRNESVGHSTLERYPILAFEDCMVLALPTAISAAVRRRVVEWMKSNGYLDNLSIALRQHQGHEAFNNGLAHYNAQPAPFEWVKPSSKNTPSFDQVACKFDDGKFGQVILLHDDLDELLDQGLTSFKSFDNEVLENFATYLSECAEYVSQCDVYTGGMTIILLGGLGRGFAFALGEMPENWHAVVLRLPDYLALGCAERFSMLRLWKLKQMMTKLEKDGVSFANVNGDINLYAYWKYQDYSLLPEEFPLNSGSNLLILSTDYVAPFRKFLRQGFDHHAVLRGVPRYWIGVRRKAPTPFFDEMERQPIYVSYARARAGHLHGVVETNSRGWWLISEEHQVFSWHRDMQFRIWDALITWLNKLAPALESEIINLPIGPIEFVIKFEDLSDWQNPDVDALPIDDAALPLVVPEIETCSVSLTIPKSFLRKFNVPENTGERELLIAITEGAILLTGTNLSAYDAARIVSNVMENTEARFFHIFLAREFRHYAASFDRPKPRFLCEEDREMTSLGLAWSVITPCNGVTIKGRQDCLGFLNALPDHLWAQVRDILLQINLASLVAIGLRTIEGISSDRDQWKLTAQAVLALYKDKESVIRAVLSRDSERNIASISVRVMIEMGVCTCPTNQGHALNKADFDSLLAKINQIILIGYHSDAIRNGYVDPEITISPSGRFVIKGDFYNSVVAPYVAGFHQTQFEEAAGKYATYFLRGDYKSDGTDKGVPEGFRDAIVAEYGVSPELLVEIQLAIERYAIEQKRLVLELRLEELVDLVTSKTPASPEQVSYLIEKIGLHPRDRWDDPQPSGFAAKDWYPWRFRRRLSLITRPMVHLEIADDPRILIAPGITGEGLEYLINRAYSGDLAPEFFESTKMRRWIGETNNRRGHEFNQHIADLMTKIGLHARSEVKMAEFGVPKSEGNLGDVDVLAWDFSKGIVLIVECKRLQFAKTIGEIAEQINRFKGGSINNDMGKHLRRYNWLSKNLDKIQHVTGAMSRIAALNPVLVTNTPVPMQFVRRLPIPSENILNASMLEDSNASELSIFNVSVSSLQC